MSKKEQVTEQQAAESEYLVRFYVEGIDFGNDQAEHTTVENEIVVQAKDAKEAETKAREEFWRYADVEVFKKEEVTK